MDRISRRAFLGCVITSGLTAQAARAIEPVQRRGGPRFKLSLAAYSFRSYLTGAQPRWNLEDFIDFCADQQLDGTELTSYYFPDPLTTSYLNAIKRKAFLLGLDISGTAVRNNFCLPPGPERQRELDHVRRWVDYAAAMGAPVIRIFSGGVPRGRTVEEARAWCVETIEEACRYAGSRGIMLALENHGGISTSADELLAIVERVRSPWFGVNLDTGNFRSPDPYRDMERVAPYAINVQLKVSIRRLNGRREPADFPRILKILCDAGYRGYIALEYEEREDPLTAVPRHLKRLRELLG